LSALVLTATGCGKKPQTSPPAPTNASAGGVEKIKKEAKDAVTATTGYLTQQKERLQKSLSDKMTDLTRQLSDLKAKSERTGDKARSEWTNALVALQQKKQLAADKLEQLKNSSSDKWQEFKAEVEAAFRKYFNPDSLRIVVVGPKDQLMKLDERNQASLSHFGPVRELTVQDIEARK